MQIQGGSDESNFSFGRQSMEMTRGMSFCEEVISLNFRAKRDQVKDTGLQMMPDKMTIISMFLVRS